MKPGTALINILCDIFKTVAFQVTSQNLVQGLICAVEFLEKPDNNKIEISHIPDMA